MMVADRWHHQCASFVNFNLQERVFQGHSGKEPVISRSLCPKRLEITRLQFDILMNGSRRIS